MFSKTKFALILFALTLLLRFVAWRYPQFAARLKERNLVAQIKARDEGTGRWIEIRDGRITSGAGLRPKPDISLLFKNAATGASLLTPPINWLNQINSQKDFVLGVDGPEDLTNWFAQTLMMMQTAHWSFGTPMPDGSMRYCNMTNGGPVFITVKDDKIVRMTPIDFDETDPQPWTIKARGMEFTPPRKTTLAPHGQNAKSIVYAPNRLLHPMKRVDFDPNGKRNPQNRGKSEYVRISWEEALDLVAGEIKRCKRDHGPGAIATSHGSHHTWGNIGYYLSALYRFANAVGMTRVHHNPDFVGRLVLGRGAPLGPHAARRPVGDLRHGRRLSAELRDDRVLGGGSRKHVRLLWRAGRHRAPAMAEESETRHQGRPRRSLLQCIGAVPAGQMVCAQADHVAGHGDGDRLRLDQGRSLRQGIREDPHRRLRRLEGLSHWARKTASPKRRSGRRRKPAFRQKTCARSPASGARSASISRPAAGATATAVPAATRPASSGRA